MNYFVVIPAYNEGPRIAPVVQEARKFAEKVLVVDDGSIDNTGEEARQSGVIVLRHKVNLGKGAALKTGVEAAWRLGAEAAVVLDGDGQHDPRHIPEFIDKLNQGADIVFGARNLGFRVPLVRFLGNKLMAVIINLIFGIYRSDLFCGYMAFTRETYQKIRWETDRYGLETEIVARVGKNGLKFAEVPIEAIYLDKYKGMTIFDGIRVLADLPRWKFS